MAELSKKSEGWDDVSLILSLPSVDYQIYRMKN
jgi:hypothetical protein